MSPLKEKIVSLLELFFPITEINEATPDLPPNTACPTGDKENPSIR